MKLFYLMILSILGTVCTACGQIATDTASETTNDTIYIPRDIEDCFAQLDKLLTDSIKKTIPSLSEEQFSAPMHMGFGTSLRNNWGLWKGSRLSKYFNDKGIFHPDDMSGIILDSYYRRTTGKEIKLEEQIRYYQNYWKVTKQPTKAMFPKGVKSLEFNSAIHYESKKNGPGYIHVGTTRRSNGIWIYDYYNGWAKVSEADVKRLKDTQETREKVLIEIFNRFKI